MLLGLEIVSNHERPALQLMPYWDHIPTAVRGEEVYKSFVYGFAQVPKP